MPFRAFCDRCDTPIAGSSHLARFSGRGLGIDVDVTFDGKRQRPWSRPLSARIASRSCCSPLSLR